MSKTNRPMYFLIIEIIIKSPPFIIILLSLLFFSSFILAIGGMDISNKLDISFFSLIINTILDNNNFSIQFLKLYFLLMSSFLVIIYFYEKQIIEFFRD